MFLRGFCLQGKSYARIGGTNQVTFLATNHVTFLATNQVIFLAMPVAQHLTPISQSVSLCDVILNWRSSEACEIGCYMCFLL